MEYIDKYFPAINGDNVDFNLSYDDLVDYIEEEPQVIVSESFDMKPSTVSVKDVSYKIEEIHEFGMPQHPLMVELICTLESLDMRTMFVNDDEVHYVSFARHHEYIADVGPLIYGGDYVDNITFPDINDHWLKASLLKTVGVYDPTVGVIAANNVSSICHAARERIEGKEGIFFSIHTRGGWFSFCWDHSGARYYGLGRYCAWYKMDEFGTNWLLWGYCPPAFVYMQKPWYTLNFNMIESNETGVDLMIDGTVYAVPRHRTVSLKCVGLEGFSSDGEIYNLNGGITGTYVCMFSGGKFMPFEASFKVNSSAEIKVLLDCVTSLELLEYVIVSTRNDLVDFSLKCSLVSSKLDINKCTRMLSIPFFSSTNGTKKCMVNRYVKEKKKYPVELPRRRFFFLNNKLKNSVVPVLPVCVISNRDYGIRVFRVENGEQLRKYGFDPYHSTYHRKNYPFFICLRD